MMHNGLRMKPLGASRRFSAWLRWSRRGAQLRPAGGRQRLVQRIQGGGGWAEGDATFYGDNPPSGATITYYQKARHVIGRIRARWPAFPSR